MFIRLDDDLVNIDNVECISQDYMSIRFQFVGTSRIKDKCYSSKSVALDNFERLMSMLAKADNPFQIYTL